MVHRAVAWPSLAGNAAVPHSRPMPQSGFQPGCAAWRVAPCGQKRCKISCRSEKELQQSFRSCSFPATWFGTSFFYVSVRLFYGMLDFVSARRDFVTARHISHVSYLSLSTQSTKAIFCWFLIMSILSGRNVRRHCRRLCIQDIDYTPSGW